MSSISSFDRYVIPAKVSNAVSERWPHLEAFFADEENTPGLFILRPKGENPWADDPTRELPVGCIRCENAAIGDDGVNNEVAACLEGMSPHVARLLPH